MTYLTAKDLKEKLATLPDDTKIAIKNQQETSHNLYFDLKLDTVKLDNIGEVITLQSPGFDETIQFEKEQLKEEVAPW